MKKMFNVTLMVIFAIGSKSYAQLGIDSLEVFKGSHGLYTIGMKFNNRPWTNSSSFKLTDSLGNDIKLPPAQHWHDNDSSLKFVNVPISYDQIYLFNYVTGLKEINKNSFRRLSKGEQSYADFEKVRSLGWDWSATPKIIQSDSSRNSIGNLGLAFQVRGISANNYDFVLEGNLSSMAADPSNTVNLSLSYFTPLVSLVGGTLESRPIRVAFQEKTIQTLKYHDLSCSAFTSIVISTLTGLQPIFIVAGYDYADVTQISQVPFREGRLTLEAQWDVIGKFGKGSEFFIDWQYWNRLSTIAVHNLQNKKERKSIMLDLKIPVEEGKSLSVQYEDGDIPPTFIQTMNVSLGLNVDLSGLASSATPK